MRWFAKGSTYVPQAWEKNTTILALGPLSENNWKGTWISGVSIIKIAWTSFYALESSIFRITFNASFPIYWGKVYQKYTNIYTLTIHSTLCLYIHWHQGTLTGLWRRRVNLQHCITNSDWRSGISWLRRTYDKIWALGKTWSSTGIGYCHLHIQTKANIIFWMKICKETIETLPQPTFEKI